MGFDSSFSRYSRFPKPFVQNLIFEGAGIRGIAYCGVITTLDSAGILQGIEKVAGTSAGTITVLAVSLGTLRQRFKK